MVSYGRFHCCATCIHFRAEKREEKTSYTCARLQYETKPTYQFHCWQPKAHVQKLIDKENQK
ncbi:hypothetical protein [Ectobacillus polymachus]|uniref:hypothetical protein n=1 Tax=Ectobacillus polymachus TaxID=1508806 RepID=UPI003A88AB48